MSDDIEHYKQRLRALLPYVGHLATCNCTQTGQAPCTCGCAALVFVVRAEVIEEPSREVRA